MIYLNTSTSIAIDYCPVDSLVNKGILVVEDSRVQRKAVVDWLTRYGINTIFEADDGQKALALVEAMEVPPAVIILDLELPHVDGIEVLQALALRNVRPAIIVASSVDEVLIGSVAAMIQALKFPLLGAFQKPCEPASLVDALRRLENPPAKNIKHMPQELDLRPEHLRSAIVNNEISTVYQPKLDLRSGKMAGAEALARWRLKDRQNIPPNVFIPLAEKVGLINDLTLKILDRALADMVEWREQGIEVPVAINLSAKCLSDPNLANDIIQRVRERDVSPHLLTFEITESALVVDLAEALANTSRLRLKGFAFSIDDYGTGFSSMQQLTRFPFNELKIDRSFVHGSISREHLRSILQSAIDMGSRLGITTVAEGVETQQELQLLKTMGCHHVQGYLISRPLAADLLLQWGKAKLQMHAEICNSD
ncbi:Oxygen sensor protein DosP [Thalassocella blandensis]|nr:Oxygen sensor protein DosP [Thalassocella blandensis]